MARGKREGSIYFESEQGLWVARIELPRGPEGQRRVKKKRSKDKGIVIRWQNEMRRQLEEHGDLPSENLTVGGWFTYWLDEVAAKDLRPRTVAGYRYTVNAQIIPSIGSVRLAALTPQHIRKVTSAVEGKGLSPTYALNVYRIMAASLKDAAREGRINRNPTELVKPPRKAHTKLSALTAAEAVKIITNSPDRYLWAAFLLTGARRGEIIGLEWDRVGEVLDLSWQLQRIEEGPRPADFEARHIKGGLYWTRPKSHAGWRLVPLVQPLAGILEEWRTVAPENPWGLVFTRVDAQGNVIPLDPDFTSRSWRQELKVTLGKTGVRLHDLRHTTVDLLYAAGVNEAVISAIVGHSTVSMTRAYRSRGDMVRDTAAMNQLTQYLGL